MERMTSDLSRSAASAERDLEQAITALKKGAHLLKYGRRGKPKFCPFRLSNDESVLLWISGKEEKHLKLSHVSRIISGQRTPIFQRYPRPEKEYQSFSLIYNDRSLDLICKDKDEAEVWFSGLKTLISRSHQRKRRAEARSEGFSSEANSPRTFTRSSSPLGSPFGGADSLQTDSGDHLRLQSPCDGPVKNGIDNAFSDVIFYAVPPKGFFPLDSAGGSVHSVSSAGSDSMHGHMKAGDTFRMSLSSAVSSSSQGSGRDDGDALGDVFIWGECILEGASNGGSHRGGSSSNVRMDSVLPKALESTVVLDVQNIACGARHLALVTKQGEIFSWGEESGGRLGHGMDADVLQPKLIDSLSNTNIELVACGEYHTCGVSLSGDLYTWGDGTSGRLGHGNEVSRWLPKRVNGPLDGIHVSYISCGTWHTAVVTSAGQLFTFGDGTFGGLGHGDRKSVSVPREVESLKGLRTVRAACGAWHTAAVVEIMVGNTGSTSSYTGRLFTWGDGDKGRLGHGDRESKLVPTCVATVMEPNFRQVACGHSLTVALTTNGLVYSMGSTVYGQLGNPQADGKLPTRVEGNYLKNFVEEIACGDYHVALLTSNSEVYTWGKGANGRLGHGDKEDRSTPTLVEALKDKQVKSIACGANFTAAICLHKWVSGVDQSMCSGCRQPFNFKRKRHNCYNCGLVFCHSCSSKKSLKASMAPNRNKPYRVCDSCFAKLRKMMETEASSQSSSSRKGVMNQGLNELNEKVEKSEPRSRGPLARLPSMEPFRSAESLSSKKTKKFEFTSSRVSPVLNGGSQWGALNITKSLNPVFGSSKKFFSASVPGSRIVSRATSPISRRVSPPRSTTPIPTLSGLLSPGFAVDDVKRTNDSLSEEVIRLRAQVENLSRRAKLQDMELERTTKHLKEAIAIAGEETAKCKAAKEVIKSLTAQLKEMAERLPVPVGATRSSKYPSFADLVSGPDSNDIPNVLNDEFNSQIPVLQPESNGLSGRVLSNGSRTSTPSARSASHSGRSIQSEPTTRNGSRTKEGESPHENEWVEQHEPGVYLTFISLPGGARDLKRVRFSRKRFTEKQAEQWWAENRLKVHEQYHVRVVDKSSSGVENEGSAH